jgi:hypothetical protein
MTRPAVSRRSGTVEDHNDACFIVKDGVKLFDGT